MSAADRGGRRWPVWALALGGLLLGGLGLVAWLGFAPWSTQVVGWRDHPFDLANIRHTLETFSWATRLWGYDPYHLYGWTPNVFYNPLATLAGAAFVAPAGGSPGAYRLWLMVLLLGSTLVFLPWLPRDPDGRRGWPWAVGGLLAGWLSLLVYPGDVGLLDANPVQVLYTGQWAQRLGVAFGLLCLERFWRALQGVEAEPRHAARSALVAAMLFGASLFCHFMSGYATAVVLALLTALWWLSGRLVKGRFDWRCLGLLPGVLVAAGLLYLDFIWVFASVNASHHSLPLLGWRVPGGALATVREVVLPALPLMLVPLLGLLDPEARRPVGLARSLHPLAAACLFLVASPANLIWLALSGCALALVAARLEGGLRVRHWLPAGALVLLWLACGPDSLRPFGLDLQGIIPFGASVGWAKLAAVSRSLVYAWLGVLAVEGLSELRGKGLIRLVAGGLALATLAVPLGLGLSLSGSERSGAQAFFGWMRAADPDAQRALLGRMERAAAETPADGYLLIEDSLHHPEGSGLAGRGLPFGHLPYLVGPAAGRPVLGGAVTTRLVTHPLAHTSRGALLCTPFEQLARDPDASLNRLLHLGVAGVMAHSPELISALERSSLAREQDRAEGLTLFWLNGYTPVLSDAQGRALPGARITWSPAGPHLVLPAGTVRARLRQVWYPFLACRATGPTGPRACELETWDEGPWRFGGCLVDDPRQVQIQVPWIGVRVEPDPAGPVEVVIESRPAAAPFWIMLLAWAAAGGACWFLGRRRGRTGLWKRA